MTAVQLEVNVVMTMSLAEALELEERLNGGAATETTRALQRAISTQLIAARDVISVEY